MKRVAILGSTGSIGTNTLDVIAAQPDRLRVVGLAARSRIDLLQQQIQQYQPQLVAVLDEEKAATLRAQRTGAVEVVAGVEGLIRLATHPDVDVVVVGTAGREALVPVLRAIEAGKQIALASKELLVMAGEILLQAVRDHHATLIPVDSEHAALFQALQGVAREEVERLIITGSGGPLWSVPGTLDTVTRAQVLHHPKWIMGPKITVDSATLMNKGLELIEARWLFDMPVERIRIIIHPQAVVHGMVELKDGSCLAHLSPCDMRLPIQYALSFPERWTTPWPRVNWTTLDGLQFFEPDLERFPCLRLAMDAAAVGGTAPVVLSAANETVVQAFLREEASFADIPRVIRGVLAQHHPVAHPSLETILQVDEWARGVAQDILEATVHVAVNEENVVRS